MADSDRTASLMTPSKLAQIKPKSAVSPAAWLNQMAADAGHAAVWYCGDVVNWWSIDRSIDGYRQLDDVIGEDPIARMPSRICCRIPAPEGV